MTCREDKRCCEDVRPLAPDVRKEVFTAFKNHTAKTEGLCDALRTHYAEGVVRTASYAIHMDPKRVERVLLQYTISSALPVSLFRI